MKAGEKEAARLGMSPELYKECADTMKHKLNFHAYGDGDGSAPIYESTGAGPTMIAKDKSVAQTVIEAFINCVDGQLSRPANSQRFVESLLGREVDCDELRRMFNSYHSRCPNFKEGEDDCPDCIAEHVLD